MNVLFQAIPLDVAFAVFQDRTVAAKNKDRSVYVYVYYMHNGTLTCTSSSPFINRSYDNTRCPPGAPRAYLLWMHDDVSYAVVRHMIMIYFHGLIAQCYYAIIFGNSMF